VIRKASIQVVTKPKQYEKHDSSGAKNKSELRRQPRGTGEHATRDYSKDVPEMNQASLVSLNTRRNNK